MKYAVCRLQSLQNFAFYVHACCTYQALISFHTYLFCCGFSARQVSVSAVLNVGWSKDADNGTSWIRHGDFLTDTQFSFEYHPEITDYEVNIWLVKYN